MKQVFLFLIIFSFSEGLLLNAQDLSVLTYENMIKTGVEKTPAAEIRYNRISPFHPPMIIGSEQRQVSELRGQEAEKFASAKKNWISAEMSIGTIGLRYERMLGPKISLGANVYLNHFWDHEIFGIDASLRFYPRGNIFFIGCALGYYSFSSITYDRYFYHEVNVTEKYTDTFDGLAISPEIGWKIDVGDAGGFYIQFGCAVVLRLGENINTVEITGNNIIYQTLSYSEYSPLASRTFYFGLGFAF